MKRGIKNTLAIILSLIAVIAFGSSYVVYSNTPAKRFDRCILLGDRYLSEFNYEAAITAFKEALAIDPMNDIAREKVVLSYKLWSESILVNNSYDAAIELLDIAREVFPSFKELEQQEVDLYLRWTDDLLSDEKNDKALDILSDALSKISDQSLVDKYHGLKDLQTNKQKESAKENQEQKQEETHIPDEQQTNPASGEKDNRMTSSNPLPDVNENKNTTETNETDKIVETAGTVIKAETPEINESNVMAENHENSSKGKYNLEEYLDKSLGFIESAFADGDYDETEWGFYEVEGVAEFEFMDSDNYDRVTRIWVYGDQYKLYGVGRKDIESDLDSAIATLESAGFVVTDDLPHDYYGDNGRMIELDNPNTEQLISIEYWNDRLGVFCIALYGYGY